MDGPRMSRSEWVYGQFNEDGTCQEYRVRQEEPREILGVNVWSTGERGY
jgi:hypothetical protein